MEHVSDSGLAAIQRTVELAELRLRTESGEALELRLRAKLSQGDVAEAVDVSVGTICRWEMGNRRPCGPRALAYSRLLAALRDLLDRQDQDSNHHGQPSV
jgi:DNA-binding transcriptional regulator YiaG